MKEFFIRLSALFVGRASHQLLFVVRSTFRTLFHYDAKKSNANGSLLPPTQKLLHAHNSASEKVRDTTRQCNT
jgi:hypothetical protein